MEMLKFYALNIVVGCFMAVSLGHYGIHLVGRRKSLETLMIGQTMQFGIIFGAFITSIIFAESDFLHEEHFGLFASLILAALFYILHGKVSSIWPFLKTEFSLIIIILSIALSHIFTAINPLIESHFVRSFVGDIVTASRVENYLLLIITIICSIYFFINRDKILSITIDHGLYGRSGQKKYFIFDIFVFVLMCISIHVFGLLFSLGMLLVPIIFFNLLRAVTHSKMLLYIVIFNSFSVIFGFLLNTYYENLPTSPVIVLVLVLIYGLFSIGNTYTSKDK